MTRLIKIEYRKMGTAQRTANTRLASCGAEFNNKSVMRFILTLSFFICAFQSCLQNSDKGHRQSETSQANLLGKEHAFQADTNRLIVLKDHFVISIDGQSKRAYTKSQLLDILKEYKSSDTLYLTIKDAPSRQLEDALKSLRELEIKTYKFEVSEDYFKLPY